MGSTEPERQDECLVSVRGGGVLIPPYNFGIVEENLYRSGVPNELNFPFLEQLHLKQIIFFGPEDIPEQLRTFIDDQGIQLLRLGGHAISWSNKNPVTEDVLVAALSRILEVSNHPLYLICPLGRHRTGAVVGCLRKMQKWSLTSIFEEYIRHAESKVRLANEQFIELFDTDLVSVPPNPPSWL